MKLRGSQDKMYAVKPGTGLIAEVRAIESMIGKVTLYYPKVGEAAVVLAEELANCERIHIQGVHEDFHQIVMSIEFEHTPLQKLQKTMMLV